MSPSSFYRRAATLSGVAASTFVIVMAATPAQAATQLLPGGLCTPLTLLPPSLGLTCDHGILKTITSGLPAPAPSSSSPVSAATPAPNPLGSVVGGVTGTVDGVTKNLGGTGGLAGAVQSVTGAVGGTLNSLGGGAAPTPGGSTGGTTGSTSGTAGGATTTDPAGGTGTAGRPTGSSAGSTPPASSLLGPAAAFLPGASLLSFADLSSSSYGSLMPLADSIPSPLIASPESKLAAVQAPLIAAGEKAAQDTGSLLGRFGGKALPGLLVVIGTALVAAVGAGNLRAWQTQLANGGLRLRLRRRHASE